MTPNGPLDPGTYQIRQATQVMSSVGHPSHRVVPRFSIDTHTGLDSPGMDLEV